MTSGQDTWSARCVETRTAGAAGGPGKPTGSNPCRAPRSDPTPIWSLTYIALGALVIYAHAAYGGNAEAV